MLELINISKTYRIGPSRLDVLKDVSFRVDAGELVAIMGASGSGKSTLMNILGALDKPDGGTYLIDGRDIGLFSDDMLADFRNQYIGFVFQSFHLLPRLNALDNVALPLLYRDLEESEIHSRAMQNLHKVGMDEWAKHKPTELSGGQQQRVAIARALAAEPKLILADEPTGALDKDTETEIMDLFVHLNQEVGLTIVLITHDQDVAVRCSRQVELWDGTLLEPSSEKRLKMLK
ncbi:MAG: ABC transporter ATP-binding protein [Pseudomonadota bacterium]